MGQTVKHFIAGEFSDGQGQRRLAITNPATQGELAQLTFHRGRRSTLRSRQQTPSNMARCPSTWRARLMLRYQALLKEHHDELGELLAMDTGKVFEDAKGDVWRGIEVVEQAANIASNMMGESSENVANGIDTVSYHQPLGSLGDHSFNFPAMIPLWMSPSRLPLVILLFSSHRSRCR